MCTEANGTKCVCVWINCEELRSGLQQWAPLLIPALFVLVSLAVVTACVKWSNASSPVVNIRSVYGGGGSQTSSVRVTGGRDGIERSTLDQGSQANANPCDLNVVSSRTSICSPSQCHIPRLQLEGEELFPQETPSPWRRAPVAPRKPDPKPPPANAMSLKRPSVVSQSDLKIEDVEDQPVTHPSPQGSRIFLHPDDYPVVTTVMPVIEGRRHSTQHNIVVSSSNRRISIAASSTSYEARPEVILDPSSFEFDHRRASYS